MNEWMDVGGLWLGVMPSVEEAGRVLQSSLAQGYSMSQTIPGQRLHAVMEHGYDMLVAAMGARAGWRRTDIWVDKLAYKHTYTLTPTHTHKRHGRAAAHFRKVRMRSSGSQPSLLH